MKKITKILLLSLMFLPIFSYAFEEARTISNCSFYDQYNIDTTFSDMQKCINEELTRDTKENKLLKSAIFIDDIYDLADSFSEYYKKNGTFILALLICAGVFISLSGDKETFSKNKFKILISSIIFGSILYAANNIDVLKMGLDKVINSAISKPLTAINVINYHDYNSRFIENSSVLTGKSDIFKKTDEITRAVIDSQQCSISHYQTELSKLGNKASKRDVRADKYLDCVDEFKKQNVGKNIEDLDNRLLFSAAIYNCSNDFLSDNKIDCGKIILDPEKKELNKVVNKYAYSIEKSFENYIGFKCDNIKDLKFKRPICKFYSDGKFSDYSSDKEYFKIENDFKNISTNFTNEVANVISVKEKKSSNSFDKIALTDIKRQVLYFILGDNVESSNNFDLLNNELNSIRFEKSKNINKNNGRVIDRQDNNIKNGLNDIETFYYANQQDLFNIIDDSNNGLDNIKNENAYLSNATLYFCTKNFKGECKISLKTFNESNQAFGYILLSTKVYMMSNKSLKYNRFANYFINTLLVVNYSPEILAFLFVFVFIVYSFITILLSVFRLLVKAIFLFFKRNDPMLFFDEFIKFKLAFLILPAILILTSFTTTAMTVIILEYLSFIPFVDNLIIFNVMTIALIIITISVSQLLLIIYFRNLLSDLFEVKYQKAVANLDTFKKFIKK